jgi:hypothetical protein
MYVPIHADGIISQFEGYRELPELDWEDYRRRYGNIQRLDRILEAEGRSVDDYQVSKQADVLMPFYPLLSADELRQLRCGSYGRENRRGSWPRGRPRAGRTESRPRPTGESPIVAESGPADRRPTGDIRALCSGSASSTLGRSRRSPTETPIVVEAADAVVACLSAVRLRSRRGLTGSDIHSIRDQRPGLAPARPFSVGSRPTHRGP